MEALTMLNATVVTVCGREFSAMDIATIQRIIASEPRPCRAEIARRTCRELGWIGADGRLKAMSCRVALLRLEQRGLLELPPPLGSNGNGKQYQPSEKLCVPDEVLIGSAGSITGLRLRPVSTKADSKLWNEAVARFHYLGYVPLSGAQQRYFVESDQSLLGVLGFGSSAWKVAPRDDFIGWTAQQRRSRLHLIVNNARFLILPWVRVRNLASRVLAMSGRRLREDWLERYGYEPVLLETFVDRSQFSGACYRAANWTYVGDTQGRGKLDVRRTHALPVKRIFVHPIAKRWREELCA